MVTVIFIIIVIGSKIMGVVVEVALKFGKENELINYLLMMYMKMAQIIVKN